MGFADLSRWRTQQQHQQHATGAGTAGGALGHESGRGEPGSAAGETPAFSQSALYQKVFALAGGHAARAVIPQIQLVSPKITRKLTTEWFADRVDGRYKACLAREAR